MMLISKRGKVVLISVVMLTLVVLVSVPSSVYAQSAEGKAEEAVQTRVLHAKGIVRTVSDGVVADKSASFELIVTPARIGPFVITFYVLGGEVEADGVRYSIDAGNGAVDRLRRNLGVQAEGTATDGRSIQLRVGGQYFWMWGHVYVARLAGSLQVEDSNMRVFLRAAIWV